MIDLGTYKDRFAESGQRVLEHAVQESRHRDQNYIAVEHILNGLAVEEADLFNSTMRDLSLDPRSVKVLIEKRLENARYQNVNKGIRIAPETIDEAALAFGMPMGPIELADTVGLDIAVAVGKELGGGGPPPVRLTELVQAGNLGRKSGRGFYTWTSGKPSKQPPGTVPADLTQRLIEPFVAEAEAALADGIVADADLVDAGAIFGTGFAPFRGGPLHYASELRATPVAAPGEPVPVV